MGSIVVRPVSERVARVFEAVVKSNGGGDAAGVFLQGDAAEQFIEMDVPPRYRSDLREGYEVRWLASAWSVGHWYGYDAHKAAE